MTKRLFAVLILSLFVAAGCGGENRGQENTPSTDAEADHAYREMREKRSVMDSPEERVAITKRFLDEFRESQHTADAVDAVVYYQGTEIGDMTGAVIYAETIRAKITDPKVAREVDKKLIAFYGESGMAAKMKELADRLAAAGALDFGDHWNVIEGAVKARDWELVQDYCAKASGMANAESIRANYPDREFSEKELKQAADDRVGRLLVKSGWAQANLGQVDEALAVFARADSMIPRYYFDIPEYDLGVYWGNTLVKKGDFEAAIEHFAKNGLIMRNEDAMAGLRKAYVGIHGNENGFEAYSDELHLTVSSTIDDFEMNDYEGNRRRFSDLRGDVTLLSLWFPT